MATKPTFKTFMFPMSNRKNSSVAHLPVWAATESVATIAAVSAYGDDWAIHTPTIYESRFATGISCE